VTRPESEPTAGVLARPEPEPPTTPGNRTILRGRTNPDGAANPGGRTILRGAVITTTAVVLGNLLGLLRDLLIAGFFGADGGTDAFLVAWTLPEAAVPLLIDGAMSLLMIPILTRALQQRAEGRTGAGDEDPVRQAVGRTLPALCAILVVLAAVFALGASVLVRVLAPGLVDPALGVNAMRIISVSVLFIGIAGYFVAALRAHLVYGPPAFVTVAMNVGIIGAILLCHTWLGVQAAVVGASVGSALMVAIQLPAFLRRVGWVWRPVRGARVALAAFVPIAAYLLLRQSQVFVERFVGSDLAAGTISHLNYAQKIGQVPSTLALILAVVTFPQLAKHINAGNPDQAHRRTAIDIHIIAAIVLAATAYLFAFAEPVVRLLFQRGAFTAADTVATGAILRIYVLGLLGQALVDVLCRSLFSERATWVPAAAMGVGLVVTGGVAAAAAGSWGAPAIAAANALGITITGALLLRGRRDASVPVRPVVSTIARLLPSTVLTTLFGLWLAARTAALPTAWSVLLALPSVVVVFVVAAVATGGIPLPRLTARRNRGGVAR
jgi:putative peptidoglycan lipid II flippase